MKGEVFFTGDIRTYIHTDRHRDSMTDPAQRAESVKILNEGFRVKQIFSSFGINRPDVGPGLGYKRVCKFSNKYLFYDLPLEFSVAQVCAKQPISTLLISHPK